MSLNWQPKEIIKAAPTANADAVAKIVQGKINRDAATARFMPKVNINDLVINPAAPDGYVTDFKETIVAGYLYAETVNSISAPSAAGKTWVVLDLACSIALGRPWHGIPTSSRPVLYLGAEHSGAILTRLQTWCDVNNDGQPIQDFYVLPEAGCNLSDAGIGAIVRYVVENGLHGALIVIDTIAAAAPEDIGNARRAADLLGRLKSLATNTLGCVLFTNHEGDNGANRGAKALHTDIGNRLRVGSDGNSVVVTCGRDRFGTGEAPSPVYYQFATLEDGRDWCAAVTECPEPAGRSSRALIADKIIESGRALSVTSLCRFLRLDVAEVKTELRFLVLSGVVVMDQLTGSYDVV